MTPHASITHVTTKQDLARFTRAHANDPAITWSVQAGPGGTLVITEHDGPRSDPGRVPELASTAA